MKTTKAHFKTFQKAIAYYCDRYKVGGWQIYFKHIELEGAYAEIDATLKTRAVEFRFNTEWVESSRTLCEEEIYKTAKHEVIHLLLWPLYTVAWDRFTTQAEVETIEEETTVRLQELLI